MVSVTEMGVLLYHRHHEFSLLPQLTKAYPDETGCRKTLIVHTS